MPRAALVSGVVALALGIAALLVGTSEVLLAVFIAAIVVTWALGEIAHARRPVASDRSVARVA